MVWLSKNSFIRFRIIYTNLDNFIATNNCTCETHSMYVNNVASDVADFDLHNFAYMSPTASDWVRARHQGNANNPGPL